MKVWILTSDSKSPSTNALRENLSQLKSNIQIEILSPELFTLQIDSQGNAEFIYDGQKLKKPNFCLLRLGWKSRESGLIIGQALESIGVKVINEPHSINRVSHKLLSQLELAKIKVPTPGMWYQSNSNANSFSSDWLNEPSSESPSSLKKDSSDPYSPKMEKSYVNNFVFKNFYGSQGFGVSWTEGYPQTQAWIDAYRNSKIPFFIQEFLDPREWFDIRCFFIGYNCIGTLRRIPPTNSIRGNFHQGGQLVPILLSEEVIDIARRAHLHFSLFYSAVDLMISSTLPPKSGCSLNMGQSIRLLEVNACPGLIGISKCLERDVAKELVHSIPFD